MIVQCPLLWHLKQKKERANKKSVKRIFLGILDDICAYKTYTQRYKQALTQYKLTASSHPHMIFVHIDLYYQRKCYLYTGKGQLIFHVELLRASSSSWREKFLYKHHEEAATLWNGQASVYRGEKSLWYFPQEQLKSQFFFISSCILVLLLLTSRPFVSIKMKYCPSNFDCLCIVQLNTLSAFEFVLLSFRKLKGFFLYLARKTRKELFFFCRYYNNILIYS